ncbi:MAG: hypothetical protein QOH79_981 [Acidimicrobiaceae bacterium]|jgi:hypothetical protein
MDLNFANALLQDPDGIVQQSGYALSREETKTVRDTVQYLLAATSPDAVFQREQLQATMRAQLKRGTDLSEYTVQLFKDTLSNAANTYKTITAMNKIMFGTGILLFVASAIVGVFSAGASAILLGALGGATFVALFLTGPVEKSQTALSNLVQVEAAFMNHFEQVTFWEAYALTPAIGSNPPMPDPARIERASTELQERTSTTLELLQKYVEPPA